MFILRAISRRFQNPNEININATLDVEQEPLREHFRRNEKLPLARVRTQSVVVRLLRRVFSPTLPRLCHFGGGNKSVAAPVILQMRFLELLGVGNVIKTHEHKGAFKG